MIYDGNILTGNEEFVPDDIIEFSYSGTPKRITLSPCRCRIDTWGAQSGRNRYNNSLGGRTGGAFTSGILNLSLNTDLWIYVGEMGYDANSGFAPANSPVAWNGGGRNGVDLGDNDHGGGGGGASDIRLISNEDYANLTSLISRIMVAGGAGGNGAWTSGPVSIAGDIVSPETAQTLGYVFGVGQNSANTSARAGGGGGGGGGGYYGGAGGNSGTSPTPGYGGSSFVSGHYGCDAIDEYGNHTGQPNHYSSLVFMNPVMINSDNEMPNLSGNGIMVGNASHGFIRITILNQFDGDIYFVDFSGSILYHNGNDWIELEKTKNEITINDIIQYGIGKDSLYLTKAYFSQLDKLGKSDRIRYITGTHTIERLKSIPNLNKSNIIELNTPIKFRIDMED